MKIRNTVILVVVFAILAGLIYYQYVYKGEEEAEERLEITYVFDFEPEEISYLQIRDNINHMTTRVARDEQGEWRMEKPFHLELDQTMVKSVVRQAGRIVASRTITDTGGDLAAFGLTEPSATLRLGLTSGEEKVLQIGDESPIQSGYYVQREKDQAVYLIYPTVVGQVLGLITKPPLKPTPTLPPEVTATPTAEAEPSAVHTVEPSSTP